MFLAINYRVGEIDRYRKPARQAAWRQFQTNAEAESWLEERTGKTADSPQGQLILDMGANYHKPDLTELLEVLAANPKSGLSRGLESWLKMRGLAGR